MSWIKSIERETDNELSLQLESRIISKGHHVVFLFPSRRLQQALSIERELHLWADTNLNDLLLILRDCAIGLKFLHDSNWIHRDVRGGKGRSFTGRGIIQVLERAKKISVNRTRQMRMGSPDFVAEEVMLNSYLFLPARYSVQANKRRIKALKLNKDPSNVLPQRLGRPLFTRNEAHDIESLWWTAIYALFSNDSVTLAQREIGQRGYGRTGRAQRIFPDGFSMARRQFLTNEDTLHQKISRIPVAFHEPANELDMLRDCLVACYQEFEGAFPRVHKEVFSDLNDHAIGVFELCVDLVTGIMVSP